MSAPRLSVVIPTRNCLEWLPRAIASVRAVPVDSLEIIVVDDGSTDGTAEYLCDLAVVEPRLRIVRHESGKGPAAARNAGLAIARAPVIGFLDADDVWFPTRIGERLLRHERHPDIVMSFSEYETLYPNGRTEPRLVAYLPRFRDAVAGKSGVVVLGNAAPGLLYAENPVCTSTVLASRTALAAVGQFDASLHQAEDWDLWIRLGLYGPVAYATDVQVQHMSRNASQSTAVGDRCRAVVLVTDRYRTSMRPFGVRIVRAAGAVAAEARAEEAMIHGSYLSALGWKAAAFWRQPSKHRLRNTLGATLLYGKLLYCRIRGRHAPSGCASRAAGLYYKVGRNLSTQVY